MLYIVRGSLFDADVEALVNPVNCDGVMGKGLALQFKSAFPENNLAYVRACHAGAVRPGRMFVFSIGKIEKPKYIINFPTKRHWRDKSRLEDIEDGLVDLVNIIRRFNIKSIAIPALGCGLGGLSWDDVCPRIKRAMTSLQDVHILLFEPVDDARQSRSSHSVKGRVDNAHDYSPR